MAAGHWFARVTVSPGKHEVRATPTRWFDRSPGKHKVLASPSGWPDAIPDDARLILFHNDRSLTAAH